MCLNLSKLLFDDHNLVRQRKRHPQTATRIPRDAPYGRILHRHGKYGEFLRGGVEADQLVRLFRALLVPDLAGRIHGDAVRFRITSGRTLPKLEFLVRTSQRAQAPPAEVSEVDRAADGRQPPWLHVRIWRSEFGDRACLWIRAAQPPAARWADSMKPCCRGNNPVGMRVSRP